MYHNVFDDAIKKFNILYRIYCRILVGPILQKRLTLVVEVFACSAEKQSPTTYLTVVRQASMLFLKGLKRGK